MLSDEEAKTLFYNALAEGRTPRLEPLTVHHLDVIIVDLMQLGLWVSTAKKQREERLLNET